MNDLRWADCPSSVRQSPSPRGIQAVRESFRIGGKQVPIAIHRDLNRRVTEVRLHRLGVGVLSDQECGTGMPEVVGPEIVEVCGVEARPPDTPIEVAPPKWLTVGRREDERSLFGPDFGR